MRTIKLHCSLLSPIHIGTGLEIDPLHYLIQNGKLYKFSLDRFVARLGELEREQLEQLVERNDLFRLRQHIAHRIVLERDAIYGVSVSSEVAQRYEDRFDDVRNQLLVQPFIRTQNQRFPIVPGSSIKGAIRTAVINRFAQDTQLSHPKNFKDELQFESLAMGYKDPKSDPFRGIKIRDAQLSNEDMQIASVKNVGKDNYGQLRPTGVSVVCETTGSGLSSQEVSFTTELLYDDQLFAAGFVKKTIGKELIAESCRDFYLHKLNMEHDKFYKGNDPEPASNNLLSESFDSGSFPLRVGRFSGVESVTLDSYRNPRPPGRSKGWGKTRNLAHGQLPMGWMKVTMVEET